MSQQVKFEFRLAQRFYLRLPLQCGADAGELSGENEPVPCPAFLKSDLHDLGDVALMERHFGSDGPKQLLLFARLFRQSEYSSAFSARGARSNPKASSTAP